MRGFFRLRSVQHIAYASDRMDHLKREPVVDLAPQVPDVDIHNIREAVVIHVPDVLDNHRSAERPAAVTHHIFEDAELFWREFDALVGSRYFPPETIKRQLAYLQLLGRGLSTPEQHSHSGQKFHECERLYEIIVGSLFQAFDAVIHRIPSGQDQDRRYHLSIANLLQHRKTVRIRQSEIETD